MPTRACARCSSTLLAASPRCGSTRLAASPARSPPLHPTPAPHTTPPNTTHNLLATAAIFCFGGGGRTGGEVCRRWRSHARPRGGLPPPASAPRPAAPA
eukprot:574972-Rhodomonas_salina.2